MSSGAGREPNAIYIVAGVPGRINRRKPGRPRAGTTWPPPQLPTFLPHAVPDTEPRLLPNWSMPEPCEELAEPRTIPDVEMRLPKRLFEAAPCDELVLPFNIENKYQPVEPHAAVSLPPKKRKPLAEPDHHQHSKTNSLQDKREARRIKNRDSAQKTRDTRKRELQELRERVAALTSENHALRCAMLSSANNDSETEELHGSPAHKASCVTPTFIICQQRWLEERQREAS